MAKKKKVSRGKDKPHLCFDRLPKDKSQLLDWAAMAKEINPHNAPEESGLSHAILASICIATGDCPAPRELTPLDMASLTTARWNTGDEITYGFPRANTKTVSIVRDALTILKEFVNLKFTETSATNAKVRITDFETGSWAYLGVHALSIPRNQATMNLARSWADLATALHECCHMLSMIHEHQSPARPDIFWNEAAVYRYYGGPPNNWGREQIKSNVIDRYSKEQVNYTELDRESIMLYPLQAELLQNPAYATGWNRTLSEMDKAFLRRIYPFPDAPPPPPPPPNQVEVNIPRAGKWVWQPT